MNKKTLNDINSAEIGQENVSPGWSIKAQEMLRSYLLNAPDDFLTEDFRNWAELNGLPKPKDGRAYGPLMLAAVKSGLIVWSGMFREMKGKDSNGCPKKVWVVNCKNEDDLIDEIEFQRCGNCDGHDACEDFGCAIEVGILKNLPF